MRSSNQPACAGEKAAALLSRFTPHAQNYNSPTSLLLERADVRDNILDLCIGEFAGIAWHFAFAIFGGGNEPGIGRLDHLRGLERQNLHRLSYRCGGKSVGSMA